MHIACIELADPECVSPCEKGAQQYAGCRCHVHSTCVVYVLPVHHFPSRVDQWALYHGPKLDMSTYHSLPSERLLLTGAILLPTGT